MKTLVVDDDSISRLLVSRVLAREPGFEVQMAKDGLVAWNLLQSGYVPDICLVDVMMPQIDGLELLVRMRASPTLRYTKVIICSSVNERFRVAMLKSLDVVDYLVKPFSPKRILEAVRKACNLCPPEEIVPDPNGKTHREPSDSDLYLPQIPELAKKIDQYIIEIEAALATGDRAAAAEPLRAIVDAAITLEAKNLLQAARRVLDRVVVNSQSNLTAELNYLRNEQRAFLVEMSIPRKAPADRTSVDQPT
jgi:CheY-like chemotaxis protein